MSERANAIRFIEEHHSGQDPEVLWLQILMAAKKIESNLDSASGAFGVAETLAHIRRAFKDIDQHIATLITGEYMLVLLSPDLSQAYKAEVIDLLGQLKTDYGNHGDGNIELLIETMIDFVAIA